MKKIFMVLALFALVLYSYAHEEGSVDDQGTQALNVSTLFSNEETVHRNFSSNSDLVPLSQPIIQEI